MIWILLVLNLVVVVIGGQWRAYQLILLALIEVVVISGLNWWCYQITLEVNRKIKKILLYCCAKRIKDYNWPVDKKLLQAAQNMLRHNQKIISKLEFLVWLKSVKKILADTELAYDTLCSLEK